jgi:hypothetical protein
MEALQYGQKIIWLLMSVIALLLLLVLVLLLLLSAHQI